jgi:outer membrane receptor protein involved in Fe transport
MRRVVVSLVAIGFAVIANAQMGGMGFSKAQSNVGHFYGKVVDSATGKAIPFAAVQLSGPKWDSASQSMKNGVIAGQLTGDNGEFSMEKLPVMGPFLIEISSIGYQTFRKTISFNLAKLMKGGQKLKSQSSDGSDINMSAVENMVNAVDRDLGNIRLVPDATQLKTVTVDGAAPAMELKLDKRVFDVGKNITTTGGTAEDVLKSIPAVNVDIDGNVTLRNSTPTIYVDGLPTTLTIDQIPADEIDKIEVITNPSAKFDAQASAGGIINIVLKKTHTLGYNGSIRAGIDERGKWNAGLNLNVRQGKINVFGSLFYHQADHIMDGITTRDNLITGAPLTDINQLDTNTMNGYFAFARGGVDYFIDNRNTLTISGSYGRGDFTTTDKLHTTTDTTNAVNPLNSTSENLRNTNSTRTFNHDGGQLLYKHLFPKEGEDFTADFSIDQGISNSNSNFSTTYYNSILGNNEILQQQVSNGTNNSYVAKADFTDPLSAKVRIETGVQATVNQVNSLTQNMIYNDITSQYDNIQSLNSNYDFNQQIYAGYVTFSHDVSSRFSYQAGLRVESSYYKGQYVDSSTSFSNQYPLSLFPSAYMVYHLTDKSDLQLNYSRHVTRPNFFQLVPYINYADSLNITQGNPDLRPQFINTFELNYLNTFDRKNSMIVSAYLKDITGLITAYQEQEYSSFLNQDILVNTFENANSANSYGLEVTSQNSIGNWLDITSNVNLYENSVNGSNLGTGLNEQLLSWFGKLNLSFKLPAQFTFQANGSYQSKSIIPVNQGGGRWGGYGPQTLSTTQGYILPIYSADLALKKDFLKNHTLSVTLGVRDVFATAVNATESTTDFFTQTTSRKRDQQFFTLNISYRFGQTDFSLFKKKNMDMPDQSQDVQGGGE